MPRLYGFKCIKGHHVAAHPLSTYLVYEELSCCSTPPLNLVEVIRRRLAQPDVVLGGFRTIIDGSHGRPLRFMTYHHLAKVWHITAPLIQDYSLSLVSMHFHLGILQGHQQRTRITPGVDRPHTWERCHLLRVDSQLCGPLEGEIADRGRKYHDYQCQS